jgi:putative SOS response-associated peptidase YedK
MCGRFALAPVRSFMKHYGLSENADDRPFFSYNIAPSMEISTIIRDNQTEIKLMKWGWWKGKVINARAETVEKKPWFLTALKKHRCIIPASGFYEWQEKSGKKIPFRFSIPEQEVFSLAGIYRIEKETNALECLILTTDANPHVQAIHHRMPVILPDSWENYWLSAHLDIPFAQLMVANEALMINSEMMSAAINSPRYNKIPEVFHEI